MKSGRVKEVCVPRQWSGSGRRAALQPQAAGLGRDEQHLNFTSQHVNKTHTRTQTQHNTKMGRLTADSPLPVQIGHFDSGQLLQLSHGPNADHLAQEHADERFYPSISDTGS